MPGPHHNVVVTFSLLILLCAGWLVLQPGLSGPFLLDDFDNLGALEATVVDAQSFFEYMSTGNAGPLDRPISKISFLLNDYTWPSTPASFKYTNILLHLLIGVIFFGFFRLAFRAVSGSTDADWVAIFAAGLWLLHPLQVSTVLYVVQRMTQLSVLFMAFGLFFHAYLRLRFVDPGHRVLMLMTANLGVFTGLAVFSKENGALLPLFVAVLEFTLFAKLKRNDRLAWWRLICVLIPSALVVGYLLYIPRWEGGYQYRDFTMPERLMTESVILWDYLQSIFSLQVYKLGLFHDDYPVYSSILHPHVLLALFGHGVLMVLALALRNRLPLFFFGVFWFYAGHVIESTTVPLELYFEHRNYISLAGVSLMMSGLVYLLFEKLSEDVRRFYHVTLIGLIGLSGAITWSLASEWGDENRLVSIWAAEHPDSPRAQRTFAQQIAELGMAGDAVDHLDYIYEKFDYDLSIPLVSEGISCAFGIPHKFDFQQLRSSVSEHRWTDGLRPAASHLLDIAKSTNCRARARGYARVLEEVVAFQNTRASGIASLLVISGDFYKLAGDGDSALRVFLRVDEIKPSVDSITRISGLFLGAGRYREARKALEIAFERDAASGIDEGRMNEYKRIFDRIDSEINKDEQYEPPDDEF